MHEVLKDSVDVSPTPLQWSGDRHGGQLGFHRLAAILGWRHGLGHDCFGYSSHRIW